MTNDHKLKFVCGAVTFDMTSFSPMPALIVAFSNMTNDRKQKSFVWCCDF